MFLSKFTTCLNKADGSLEITMQKQGCVSIARIKSWQDGLGLEVIQGRRNDFKFLDFESTLLNKAHGKDMSLPIHAFISQIPEKIVAVAEQQYFLQYQILRVLRQSPKAYELLQLNKYLFLLIIYHQQNINKTSHLLKMPQHKILQSLYPENHSQLSYKSVVRILKYRLLESDHPKCMDHIDGFLSRLFSGQLACTHEKTLLHIKYIPISCLTDEHLEYCFLLRPGVLFERVEKLVTEINTCFEGEVLELINRLVDNVFTNIRDINSMVEPLDMDKDGLKKMILNVADSGELDKIHIDLINFHNTSISGEMMGQKLVDFQSIKPPIPGTNQIIPLCDHESFIKESETMEHCLAYAGYAKYVAQGKSYIYKIITDNDRCTLEVGINNRQKFYVKQLQGYQNCVPKQETIKLVRNWINKHLQENGIKAEFGEKMFSEKGTDNMLEN